MTVDLFDFDIAGFINDIEYVGTATLFTFSGEYGVNLIFVC